MYQARFREIHLPVDSSDTSPDVDLVWFTHAGGASNALIHKLRQTQQQIQEWTSIPFRLLTPMPPLREDAAQESFDGELVDLASHYCHTLVEKHQLGSRPFVVLGHSFGTVVAYEATCALISRGLTPHRLVAMSFPAPDRLTHETKLHTLDDQGLIDQVDELFGGVPADIQNNPEALPFFVPGLRFDLGLLERYQLAQGRSPLPVPITAMVGTDDRAVDLADAHRWDLFTDSPVGLQTLPGDHFFPHERLPEVLDAAVWGLKGDPQKPARQE